METIMVSIMTLTVAVHGKTVLYQLLSILIRHTMEVAKRIMDEKTPDALRILKELGKRRETK